MSARLRRWVFHGPGPMTRGDGGRMTGAGGSAGRTVTGGARPGGPQPGAGADVPGPACGAPGAPGATGPGAAGPRAGPGIVAAG
ncbi:MAG TPA: hypothetical protein VEB23_13185, partial [Ramlibacter sp.]|nr:hypothetical protein [Ramlibacter sp.]